MDEEEPYVRVCGFPPSEEHRAYNLADYLERNGVGALVQYGEVDSVPEAEAVAVLAPESQWAEALRLAESFVANYREGVAALVEGDLKAPLGFRLYAGLYVWALPALVLLFGLHELWTVASGGYPGGSGTPPGSELGVGIMATLVGAGWLLMAVRLTRKAV